MMRPIIIFLDPSSNCQSVIAAQGRIQAFRGKGFQQYRKKVWGFCPDAKKGKTPWKNEKNQAVGGSGTPGTPPGAGPAAG